MMFDYRYNLVSTTPNPFDLLTNKLGNALVHCGTLTLVQ